MDITQTVKLMTTCQGSLGTECKTFVSVWDAVYETDWVNIILAVIEETSKTLNDLPPLFFIAYNF